MNSKCFRKFIDRIDFIDDYTGHIPMLPLRIEIFSSFVTMDI